MVWIEAHPPGSCALAIACSGGLDSLALLLLLWGHYPERRKDFKLFHFNHNTRGTESDEDAVFVHSLAQSLGLPCFIEKHSEPLESPSEADLRQLRLRAFQKMTESSDAYTIFFGHHLNDVLETQLMRLSRGASSEGLAAPRPISQHKKYTFLRPLLKLKKSQLEEALKGVPWREDPSNASSDYLRNRIRHELLPSWQALTPANIFQGAAISRELLEEDAEALAFYLSDLRSQYLKTSPQGAPFLDLQLASLPPRALLRRLLQLFLNQENVNLNRAAFTQLLDHLERKESYVCSVNQTQFLRFDGASLIIESRPEEQLLREAQTLSLGEDLVLADGSTVLAEEITLSEDLLEDILSGSIDNHGEVYIDLAQARGGLYLHSWQPGDAYRPLGAPGSQKLQDLFVNKKINKEERHRRPLFCLDQAIVWVPGFPPADAFKLSSSSKYALRLTWRPFL